jgi:Ca2+-binding EF-hand superfamily protein
LVSYNKLRTIIDIYSSCPSRLKGDINNSDAFRNSIEQITSKKSIGVNRTEKLLKHIHLRVEEKFKDYRSAFRSFDKNYVGNLTFKEFMNGLENIGIRLALEDFKILFEILDYNKTGEIGFNKFCLLNTDRSKDI